MRHVYTTTLLHNRLLLHLRGSHDIDHWVRGGTKPVIPLCTGNMHHFVNGKEAITSQPPLHQEGAIITEAGVLEGSMGVIIIERGQSVWVSDRVVISKIWMEGGRERTAISGFMRKSE